MFYWHIILPTFVLGEGAFDDLGGAITEAHLIMWLHDLNGENPKEVVNMEKVMDFVDRTLRRLCDSCQFAHSWNRHAHCTCGDNVKLHCSPSHSTPRQRKRPRLSKRYSSFMDSGLGDSESGVGDLSSDDDVYDSDNDAFTPRTHRLVPETVSSTNVQLEPVLSESQVHGKDSPKDSSMAVVDHNVCDNSHLEGCDVHTPRSVPAKGKRSSHAGVKEDAESCEVQHTYIYYISDLSAFRTFLQSFEPMQAMDKLFAL